MIPTSRFLPRLPLVTDCSYQPEIPFLPQVAFVQCLIKATEKQIKTVLNLAIPHIIIKHHQENIILWQFGVFHFGFTLFGGGGVLASFVSA